MNISDIVIQLLLVFGALILMGLLGTMIFAFCFMVNNKEDTDND